MNTRRLYRIVIIMIAVLFLAGCNLVQNTGKNIESANIIEKNAPDEDTFLGPRISDILSNTSLIINDIPIDKSSFYEHTEGGFTEIMLDSEVLRYTFKKPGISNNYPEYTEENGKINVVWMDNGEAVLTVNMTVGSNNAFINDKAITLKTPPKTVDERLYIPISPFTEALGMKETNDEALNLKLLHCSSEVTMDILSGKWSDSETCLLETFDAALAGNATLPTFAVGYEFKKDGTYRYMIIGADGFKDTLLLQEGKYRIFGSTIIYYDILETIYEGNPLELVYKDTPLDHPFFEFIGDYDADNSQIVIGDFWLNRIAQ